MFNVHHSGQLQDIETCPTSRVISYYTHYSLDINHWIVGPGGLEPPTSRLSGVRSSQLSYEPDLLGPSVERGFLTPPVQIGLRLNHILYFIKRAIKNAAAHSVSDIAEFY